MALFGFSRSPTASTRRAAKPTADSPQSSPSHCTISHTDLYGSVTPNATPRSGRSFSSQLDQFALACLCIGLLKIQVPFLVLCLVLVMSVFLSISHLSSHRVRAQVLGNLVANAADRMGKLAPVPSSSSMITSMWSMIKLCKKCRLCLKCCSPSVRFFTSVCASCPSECYQRFACGSSLALMAPIALRSFDACDTPNIDSPRKDVFLIAGSCWMFLALKIHTDSIPSELSRKHIDLLNTPTAPELITCTSVSRHGPAPGRAMQVVSDTVREGQPTSVRYLAQGLECWGYMPCSIGTVRKVARVKKTSGFLGFSDSITKTN